MKKENWSYSQEFRHQCDVRYLLKVRTEQGLVNFREWVVKTGLSKRWHQVSEDFNDQWKKGNRGADSDWRK